MTRTEAAAHARRIRAHACDPDLVAAHGTYTAERPEDLPEGVPDYWDRYLPAIVYLYRDRDGRVEYQLGPRKRDKHKYLTAEETRLPLNCLRDNGGPILFQEGNKQQYAALTYAPSEFAIYGLDGCWGWAHDDLSFVAGRDVTVDLDADLSRNPDVYDAAKAFMEARELAGTASVKFVMLPGPGTQGLDDYLANITRDEDRRGHLLRLLQRAVAKLPGRPKGKRSNGDSSPWFDEHGGLKAVDVAGAINKEHQCHLTDDPSVVAVYSGGVYRVDPAAVSAALVDLLANKYRAGYESTINKALIAKLKKIGKRLPDLLDEPLLNCANVLVDLRTGEQRAHSFAVKSSVQLPVKHDPAATCPTYEQWAKGVMGDQVDAVEETIAQMLDPTRRPTKALFLYGPTRTGKSTLLRLLEALAGSDNRSAVTLHQLADNRFMAANVHGKILNAANDLSAAPIKDLSIFKMMTGEDPIQADRKFGGQFAFTSKALFAFSANEVPSVGENSRAYFERMRPILFDQSFAGAEDPSIEQAMLKELPGILNRLIRAWQRRQDRGKELPVRAEVQAEFERASDRVTQWVAEEMFIDRTVSVGQEVSATDGFTRQRLSEMFNDWAEVNHLAGLGRNKLASRLTSMYSIVEVKIGPNRQKGLNIRPRRETDPPDGSDGSCLPPGIGGTTGSQDVDFPGGDSRQKPSGRSKTVRPLAPCRVCDGPADHEPYGERCTRLTIERDREAEDSP
jgi:putative DNA primase/helicase